MIGDAYMNEKEEDDNLTDDHWLHRTPPPSARYPLRFAGVVSIPTSVEDLRLTQAEPG